MGPKGADLGSDKYPMEIFHLWFMTSPLYKDAESEFGPAPGFLAGGSDVHDFDQKDISPPWGEPEQKAYRDRDFDEFYIFSEPAIEYQAAYQLLLGYFCD